MIHSIKRILTLTALSLAIAGCGGSPKPIAQSSTVELVELTELPAPESGSDRLIAPQEQLDISVVDSALLSGTFVTDSRGYISYPLVGDLFLAGKSPSQASKMIADRLRGDLVLDPQVNVRLTDFQTQSISVGGQVTRPGTYPAISSTSLLRAVNNAGGLAEYAKSDDVLIMRTVGGQRYIGVYNIEAIQRGNYSDPTIFPNDIVTVGESVSRRRLDTLLQIIPLATSAAILIERTLAD